MLDHDDFQHLGSFKWEAFRRLADVAGITTLVVMLKDTPERLQRVAFQDFVNCKLADFRRRALAPADATGSDAVKLDISCYSGEEPKRLALNQ
ncbi:unnamed protein product [Peronospora belbahrii]|uniref:Uncharacterized protein n=1 Tax=Peronospora belbahrii TaxID=622444 RepID=A0AAU9KM12_9STRA|nr:unnamed protein product [Peronospora belbahrii]